MPISLGELAATFGCELIGDPDAIVNGVASLTNATPESLTFLASPSYNSQLPSTKAAAVVTKPVSPAVQPAEEVAAEEAVAE